VSVEHDLYFDMECRTTTRRSGACACMHIATSAMSALSAICGPLKLYIGMDALGAVFYYYLDPNG